MWAGFAVCVCVCVCVGVLSDVLDYVLEPANIIQREATPAPDATDNVRPIVGQPPLSLADSTQWIVSFSLGGQRGSVYQVLSVPEGHCKEEPWSATQALWSHERSPWHWSIRSMWIVTSPSFDGPCLSTGCCPICCHGTHWGVHRRAWDFSAGERGTDWAYISPHCWWKGG